MGIGYASGSIECCFKIHSINNPRWLPKEQHETKVTSFLALNTLHQTHIYFWAFGVSSAQRLPSSRPSDGLPRETRIHGVKQGMSVRLAWQRSTVCGLLNRTVLMFFSITWTSLVFHVAQCFIVPRAPFTVLTATYPIRSVWFLIPNHVPSPFDFKPSIAHRSTEVMRWEFLELFAIDHKSIHLFERSCDHRMLVYLLCVFSTGFKNWPNSSVFMDWLQTPDPASRLQGAKSWLLPATPCTVTSCWSWYFSCDITSHAVDKRNHQDDQMFQAPIVAEGRALISVDIRFHV